MEDSKNNQPQSKQLKSLVQRQIKFYESDGALEVEGKTPAEAIAKALVILGLTRKEVKVKILSEEQRGLFGMEGAQPAKVRVTLIKKKKT